MSYDPTAPQQDRPSAAFVLIIQHTSLRSWDVFLSLFNSLALALHPPDIICLQDPPYWCSCLPFFNGSKSFWPPTLAAQSQRLPFMFLVVVCPMLRFFLGFLTDLMLLPLICSGSTSLVDPVLSSVF